MGKIRFPLGKWSFEPTGNSARVVEFLALGKTLDIFIDYLMFYTDRHAE